MTRPLLGTMTKSASAPSSTARAAAWHMRSASGYLLGGRVDNCGRVPLPDQFVTLKKRRDGSHYFAGTRKCGLVHVCPVCSARVGKARAEEMRAGLLNALAEGLYITAVVPTIRHTAEDSLAELLEQLKESWRRMFSGRAGKALYSKLGVVGTIRADEVTYGYKSGWHPHMHVLLITTRPLEAADGWELFWRFEQLAEKAGAFTSEAAWVGGFENLKDAGGLSDYLCKMEKLQEVGSWSAAEELALSHMKSGRKRRDASGWTDRVRLSPWEILREFTLTGDLYLGDKFREYAAAYKGRRRLVWSRGLKERLGVSGGLTDEELAQDAGDDDGEAVYTFEKAEWRTVVGSGHDLRLALLRHVESGGQVGEWLQRARYGFVSPCGEFAT